MAGNLPALEIMSYSTEARARAVLVAIIPRQRRIAGQTRLAEGRLSYHSETCAQSERALSSECHDGIVSVSASALCADGADGGLRPTKPEGVVDTQSCLVSSSLA